MPLYVREVFPTIQGEGSLTGTPAVFVRLSGCNLWSGHERDRVSGKGDCAMWCDTDFALGHRRDPGDVVNMVKACSLGWRSPLVVISGGEPLLQLVKAAGMEMVTMLRHAGFRVAIETNGTQPLTPELESTLDHITVSPKGLARSGGDAAHIKLLHGTDLKVVWPSPFGLEEIQGWAAGFRHCFLQPKDEGNRSSNERNMAATIEAAASIGFRVSVQTHKLAGLP